jgi:hypothetical protein
MHWVYKQGLVADALEQGDVLEKTEGLVELLRSYHPYYADHPANRFFVVLTQSCDLVRRSGVCKSRYIALAPARPLESIIDYEFRSQLYALDDGRPLGSERLREDVQRLLNRLFNNNEPSYFFLEAEPSAGLYDSMCAMLALPISFKAEHYSTLLEAKILGVEDAFQAKLGWLLGQLYSRVGTRDIDAEDMSTKVGKVISTLAVWLDSTELAAMKGLIDEHRKAQPAVPVDEAVVGALLKKIPKRKAEVIEAVLAAAEAAGLAANPSPERRKMRVQLENSAAFAAFFR